MSLIYLFFLSTILTQTFSFQLKPTIRSPLKLTSSSLSMKNDHSLEKKGMAALLGALFFFNNPDASHALQSGGRSGGSSFRSSGSTRSYSSGGGYSSFSAPSRSYSSGPSINIMPMYSPFRGFGFSPYGFSPF